MTGGSNLFGAGGGDPGGGTADGGFQGNPNWAAILQTLQALVQATNSQAQYIKATGFSGGTASGDISGMYPGPITVSATHLTSPLPLSQGGTGNGTGQPSGSAGGDLSGSFPTPTVAKINGASLGTTTATSGNLLIGSGSAWVTEPMSGDATITSLGALTIAANAITTGKINASAVTYAKIQNESATTLLGNPTGGAAAPSEITLGSTLTFSGSALQTTAHTGDATSSANSNAMSLVAIGGNSITPASWTPSDGSGASLTFTAVSANYTRLGNLVFAYGTVTYPSTANGSQATIAGLPFTVANHSYALSPCAVFVFGGSIAVVLRAEQNTNTLKFWNAATGAAITNANLSLLGLSWMAIYTTV